MSITEKLLLTETLAPADQAAVSDAVRDACERGLAVQPIGGGTMPHSFRHTPCAEADGTRSVPDTLGLSTAKLNRLIDYQPDDMTITVEAGMTIGELQRLLAEKRQWLPVDVAYPDRATVGEAIARNAAGPQRYAYGTMRDYLLGFTAVDGTGMVFSGGGRVVKNAAGYNMCRLMAGSLSTLGIITQATLMVRPLSEAAALLACEVRDFDLAEKLLAGLTHSLARPVAVELSAGRPHEGNPLFGPVSEYNVARLYVGFEGSAAEVEWMLGQLRQEWTALGMTSPVLMPNVAADRLWRWIVESPADVQLSVLPSRVVETIVELLKISPDCTIHAHAGDGVIRVGGLDENSRELTAPAELPNTDPAIRVMRAIRERFDPKNILNP
jgi:glycolate oxidase FAD binding subunit